MPICTTIPPLYDRFSFYQPTLYSILFLNQLKLGHYDCAFISLNKNPDRSRRVDCLRELVITLMNSNCIDTLLKIPYNDLLPQLEDIMEQRARSLQPQKAAIYYNFLYALHIKYENYKKGEHVFLLLRSQSGFLLYYIAFLFDFSCSHYVRTRIPRGR